LLCVAKLVFAQTSYNITNYTSRDELSNSSVTNVCIDSSGFLWISTELGLNKFDGKKFRKFTSYNSAITDNQITNVVPVGNNKLFVTTGTSGFFLFDSKENKASKSSVNFSSHVFKVVKLVERNKLVYILNSNSNKIKLYDLEKGKISDSIVVLGSFINDFAITQTGEVIIATDNGLKSYKNRIVTNFENHSEYSGSISSVVARKNAVYFSIKGKIIKYDRIKNLTVDSITYDSTLSFVNKMFLDRNENLWFSTNYPSVLFCFEKQSKQLRNFESIQTLADNSITSITEDIENNIWIGTYNKGLYKIAQSVFVAKNILENENLNYIDVDERGNYYFGTRNGLEIFYKDSNKVTNVRNNQTMREYIYKVIPLAGRSIVVANSQPNIIKAKSGAVYQFVTYRRMEKINDTVFIVGGWDNKLSLVTYNYKKSSFVHYKTIPFDEEDGNRNRVNCFFLDSKGLVWCGTDEGLYRYNLVKDELDKIDNQHFNHKILDVIEDDNSTLYVSTEKELLSYSNGKITQIREINNQIIEKVTCFEKDNSGNIFLGTYNGLYKIRKSGFNEYYSEEDGLSSKEINDMVYNKSNNTLLIATNEGMCELNLYLNKYISKHIPIIYVDSITSNGKVNFESNEFNVEQRNLSIYFGSIGYSKTNSIKYKWVLDNGNENTVQNAAIELAELRYGKHVLEIYATNDGKNWSRPYFVRINVITPFYLTWWFTGLEILLAVFIIIFIIAYRIKKVRAEAQRKSDIEQKIVQLKYEALNAAINPHFIFNALSSVQHYIHMNKNDEASDYLAKFGYLIRQTLEMATLHFISIYDEVERLRIYIDLEQLRFENKFNYEIEIDPAIDIHKTKIPNMILQPLIENSIIHGFKELSKDGFIQISFKKEGKFLRITIEDNGSGLKAGVNTNIKRKDKTKSIAVQNIKDRITTIQGASISIIDKSAADETKNGVLVDIVLPFS
jgi:ligand-binding sensor domain-containing protein